MPSLLNRMNGQISNTQGDAMSRIIQKTYNLDSPADLEAFSVGKREFALIPGTNDKIEFDNEKRVGIVKSKLGASNAIGLGAYAYALDYLGDEKCKYY